MDKELLVQNVKEYCKRKGIKPTVACRESGAGTSFITNIAGKGQVPSVEKVQQLAAYLGVTTSELLGETAPVSKLDTDQPQDDLTREFVRLFGSLPKDKQEFVLAAMRGMKNDGG